MSSQKISKFKIKMWATVVFAFYTRKQRKIYVVVFPWFSFFRYKMIVTLVTQLVKYFRSYGRRRLIIGFIEGRDWMLLKPK
jgi:hypothetical protein